MKITLGIILAIVVYIIFTGIYYFFFFRYDFDSQEFFGVQIKPLVTEYKLNNPDLDEITCKSLIFSFYTILLAPKDLVTEFTLKDGNKLTEEQYKRVLEKIKLGKDRTKNGKGTQDKSDNDFDTCFTKFSINKTENGIFFYLDEDEKKFIKENTTAIKDMVEQASILFSKDVVNYITGDNVSVSDADKISFIALLSARYAKFASF